MEQSICRAMGQNAWLTSSIECGLFIYQKSFGKIFKSARHPKSTGTFGEQALNYVVRIWFIMDKKKTIGNLDWM